MLRFIRLERLHFTNSAIHYLAVRKKSNMIEFCQLNCFDLVGWINSVYTV